MVPRPGVAEIKTFGKGRPAAAYGSGGELARAARREWLFFQRLYRRAKNFDFALGATPYGLQCPILSEPPVIAPTALVTVWT